LAQKKHSLLVVHNGLVDLAHMLRILVGRDKFAAVANNSSKTLEAEIKRHFRFVDTKAVFMRDPQHWVDVHNQALGEQDSDRRLKVSDFYGSGPMDTSVGTLAALLAKFPADAAFHNAAVDALATGALFQFFMRHDPTFCVGLENQFYIYPTQ
jgi:hypothetical protein